MWNIFLLIWVKFDMKILLKLYIFFLVNISSYILIYLILLFFIINYLLFKLFMTSPVWLETDNQFLFQFFHRIGFKNHEISWQSTIYMCVCARVHAKLSVILLG